MPLVYLWKSEDEKGLYRAIVRRTGPYKGVLELQDLDGNVLRHAEVHLAFGARFGPDISDVQSWNQLATQWSNELDKSATNT